jgi:hypothetical protein
MHLTKFTVILITWGFLLFTAGFCEDVSGQTDMSFNKTMNASAETHEINLSGPPPTIEDLHVDPETGESDVTSWGYVKCDTSMGSPTNTEIEMLYQMFHSHASGSMCVQANGIGSKCTTLGKYNGGEVSLCGSWLYHVKCTEVAWAIGMIRDACKQSDGRAGGTWVYDKHLRTVLH